MKKDIDDVKLSFVITCYNHELYIRQCIESIINLELPFGYEILVCDDCSTDKSYEIIKQCISEHPGLIQAFRSETNQGAIKSTIQVKQKHCRGQYFTGIDGDDWFIKNDFILKQIEFLDSHPQFIGVTYRRRLFSENQNVEVGESKLIENDDGVFTVDDYLYQRAYGQTLIRNFWADGIDYESIAGKRGRNCGEMYTWFFTLMHGNLYIGNDLVVMCRVDRIKGASNYNSLFSFIDWTSERLDIAEWLQKNFPEYKFDYIIDDLCEQLYLKEKRGHKEKFYSHYNQYDNEVQLRIMKKIRKKIIKSIPRAVYDTIMWEASVIYHKIIGK